LTKKNIAALQEERMDEQQEELYQIVQKYF
jgi:hypothetical protein